MNVLRYTKPILYFRKTTRPQGRITMLTIPFPRRYHEIFNEADSPGTHRHQQNTDQIPIGGKWQLIVKLAGGKRKRAKRSAYAYEARNLQGEVVFCGITVLGAVLLDLLQVQFRRQ
ncbi:hypothetical protein CMV_018556 [Castanea mollissima]|uniref:Uncharacterized protein n=1 Tax=Castanea mollissima TaxID=60419 RepID=A0A8J4QRE5_9ROSI|nr:hypothetical protein CMV_018556 [Castanea mollissima]